MVKGILLGFLAMAIFSCGDAAVKAIGDRMTVFEIGFFATLFACVALPFVRQPHERWRDMFRMHRPGLVMVRTVAGVLAGVFSTLAFTTLPLAEVYSLIFLSPLFVTILSIPFLGETIGWRWRRRCSWFGRVSGSWRRVISLRRVARFVAPPRCSRSALSGRPRSA